MVHVGTGTVVVAWRGMGALGTKYHVYLGGEGGMERDLVYHGMQRFLHTSGLKPALAYQFTVVEPVSGARCSRSVRMQRPCNLLFDSDFQELVAAQRLRRGDATPRGWRAEWAVNEPRVGTRGVIGDAGERHMTMQLRVPPLDARRVVLAQYAFVNHTTPTQLVIAWRQRSEDLPAHSAALFLDVVFQDGSRVNRQSVHLSGGTQREWIDRHIDLTVGPVRSVTLSVETLTHAHGHATPPDGAVGAGRVRLQADDARADAQGTVWLEHVRLFALPAGPPQPLPHDVCVGGCVPAAPHPAVAQSHPQVVVDFRQAERPAETPASVTMCVAVRAESGLGHLRDLAEQWRGPISAVVLVRLHTDDLDRVAQLHASSNAVRFFASLHVVVYGTPHRPPALNTLKNVARRHARSDLVCIVDAGVVPSRRTQGVMQILGSLLRRASLPHFRHVFALPIFAVDTTRTHGFLDDKSELAEALGRGAAHTASWDSGVDDAWLGEWMEQPAPYRMPLEMHRHVALIESRTRAPPLPELPALHMVHGAHMYELQRRGFELTMLTECFLHHNAAHVHDYVHTDALLAKDARAFTAWVEFVGALEYGEQERGDRERDNDSDARHVRDEASNALTCARGRMGKEEADLAGPLLVRVDEAPAVLGRTPWDERAQQSMEAANPINAADRARAQEQLLARRHAGKGEDAWDDNVVSLAHGRAGPGVVHVDDVAAHKQKLMMRARERELKKKQGAPPRPHGGGGGEWERAEKERKRRAEEERVHSSRKYAVAGHGL